MNRSYVIPFASITLGGTAQTLAFVQAPTAAPIVALEFTRAFVSQAANATSAQQRVQLSRQVSTWPTLTSVTPVSNASNDPASKITGGTAGAAGTCGINASAEGAGTKTVIYPDDFNVLNGWLWVPTPDDRITEAAASTAEGLGLVFPASPTTLSGWSGALVYKEIG